jgi:hypothetical protein
MRGQHFSDDKTLPEKDLEELCDLLAIELYHRMGPKVYLLGRNDIRELVQSYVEDLSADDQEAVPWLIWDLFQEGMELEFG